VVGCCADCESRGERRRRRPAGGWHDRAGIGAILVERKSARAIELGERAVDLVHNGRFGRMAAIARNEVIDVELREVMGTRKIPLELFEKMRWLFG
jgi:6-phosphofructokinase